MDLEREPVIAALGGEAAVARMDAEQRAEALEGVMEDALDAMMVARFGAPPIAPSVAELEQLVETRAYRRGVGNLFAAGAVTPFGNPVPGMPTHVKRLEPMPKRPTLFDFFRLRFAPATHVLQSADMARRAGMPEDVVFACLIHDTAHALMRADHGYWAAQLYEPYVSAKVTFGVRYHQALRFFPDATVGYEYPGLYRKIFGKDYEPPEYVRAAYEFAKSHEWYMMARLITVNDLYSFDPNHVVAIEEFEDVIGRQFRQPKEGLGFDNSPVAHMWRTIAMPDAPL
jgi:hypothetical protein